MAHVIAILRIAMGTIGLLFGYYKLFDNNLEAALDIYLIDNYY